MATEKQKRDPLELASASGVDVPALRQKHGEIWGLELDGVAFVFRYPDPDTFDEALANVLAGEKSGEWIRTLRGFETLIKSCCISHKPDELDSLRRAPRRWYGLFRDLGPQVLRIVAGEQADAGKG